MQPAKGESFPSFFGPVCGEVIFSEARDRRRRREGAAPIKTLACRKQPPSANPACDPDCRRIACNFAARRRVLSPAAGRSARGRRVTMFSYKDHNHQVVGPLPADGVRQLIGGGAINRFTLVRADGTDFWQPAEKFAEFRELFERLAELEVLSKPGNESVPADAPTPVIDVTASVTQEPSSGAASDATARESPERPPGVPAASPPPAGEPPPPRGGAGRFYMIGGDGREYGPVSEAQLREWIAQRRANIATRIRREDQADFTALGTWVEFASALGAAEKPPSAAPPPPLDSAQADQLAADIIGRGYDLAIGRCFARSWKLYAANFWLLTGTTAVLLILHPVLHSVPVVGNVAAVALGGVLSAGLSGVFLKLIRGQRAEFSDLFAGFQRSFVPLMLASAITFILVSAGLLLCALPGIYLGVAWLFTYPLIIERSLDFWPAMELSRKVVHERWWEVFALTLVALGLFVGSILLTVFVFGIGMFFTAPIAFGALMYAFEDIFAERRERAE